MVLRKTIKFKDKYIKYNIHPNVPVKIRTTTYWFLVIPIYSYQEIL